MGGTWVHWGQAHVWREIQRYNMQNELEVSYDFTRGINKYLLATPEGTQQFTHEEEVSQAYMVFMGRRLTSIGRTHAIRPS